MLNLNNIKNLFDYKLVELSPEERNFVLELGIGYALTETLSDEEVQKFYLEYQMYLYKNKEELIADARCIYGIFKDEYNIKSFMEWFFESKVFIFKPLYNLGFSNFWNIVTTLTYINIV